MNIIKRLATGVVMLAGTWSAAGQEIIEYIHTDALGSPVAVSDAAGNVIERTVYEPYGANVGAGPSDAPGFTGHVADSATGLTYMQQRYVDPQLGVFLSVDPINARSHPVDFFNRYKYAANNPFKFTDPDGRCAKVTGSNICGGGGVASAMLATSARSPLDIGARRESGAPAQANGSASAVGEVKEPGGKWQTSSVFTGDTETTFTYAAALGVGGKAELREGPDNDRYGIITPALGASAAGTWNLFTGSYNFKPEQKVAPVDSGLNVGGQIGLVGVLGANFRYIPPAKFQFSINGGMGAAARVEMYEVGATPGKLP